MTYGLKGSHERSHRSRHKKRNVGIDDSGKGRKVQKWFKVPAHIFLRHL